MQSALAHACGRAALCLCLCLCGRDMRAASAAQCCAGKTSSAADWTWSTVLAMLLFQIRSLMQKALESEAVCACAQTCSLPGRLREDEDVWVGHHQSHEDHV